MEEVEELILANSPEMKIKRKESKNPNVIGSLSFKCGSKSDKNRILPFGWNRLQKIQCKCDEDTGKRINFKR